jgi:thiol peroxidase
MASITLQGNEIHTTGNLPEVGTVAQNFTLVAEDLSEKSLLILQEKK